MSFIKVKSFNSEDMTMKVFVTNILNLISIRLIFNILHLINIAQGDNESYKSWNVWAKAGKVGAQEKAAEPVLIIEWRPNITFDLQKKYYSISVDIKMCMILYLAIQFLSTGKLKS